MAEWAGPETELGSDWSGPELIDVWSSPDWSMLTSNWWWWWTWSSTEWHQNGWVYKWVLEKHTGDTCWGQGGASTCRWVQTGATVLICCCHTWTDHWHRHKNTSFDWWWFREKWAKETWRRKTNTLVESSGVDGVMWPVRIKDKIEITYVLLITCCTVLVSLSRDLKGKCPFLNLPIRPSRKSWLDGSMIPGGEEEAEETMM